MSHQVKVVNEIADILCEFLELAVHNILYSRKLYPTTIFTPKRKYGVVVYQSVHPEVNSYISDCFKAVNYYLRKSQLKQFCVAILSGENVLEKFVFEVSKTSNDFESDPYLLRLERSLRDFCLKLHSSGSLTDSLPSDSTFSIQISTSELASLEFNDNPKFEDFPWVQCGLKESVFESPDIIPLQNIELSYLTVQTFIETPCMDY